MVSSAALVAHSASISTPVGPTQPTATSARMPGRPLASAGTSAKLTSTPLSARLWHIGIVSGVRLAAITAATSATASTLPLAMLPA